MVAMTERAIPDDDPLLPLWRSAQVLRVASLAYAIGALVPLTPDLDRPILAWAFMAGQIVWTGVAVTALSTSRPRRGLVIIDIVLAVAFALSSWAVATPADWRGHDVLPTMLWCTNAVVSAALLWGRRAGLAVAFLVGVECNLLTGDLHTVLWRNARVPVLICVGLAIGALARTATRANDQLRTAVEMRAATEERERLARQVHDGALQVLALVARRGGSVDTELAALAGTQEQSLRRLLSQLGPAAGTPVVAGSASAAPGEAPRTVDVGAALTGLEADRVSVSAPQEPVLLPAADGGELVAAAREALHNIDAHAGPQARAYVLVEDLATEVVVTIRDDGPGIPAGRLAQAAAQGRLGVSQSIRGRVEAVGGTAALETGPDEGTEWELRVPRRSP